MAAWNLRGRIEIAAAWLVVVALGTFGAWSLRIPEPIDAGAPSRVFSAERALAHVANVAQQPHPIGSAEIENVRDYLDRQLHALGLTPAHQRITVPDYFGIAPGPVDVVNIMARIEGSSPSGAILLMGHYDSAPSTPGANDNAAAVGAILETGRAVLAGLPMRNDVILLFTDGEEPPPRLGASAFVADHPWFADVRLVVNFEAIGGSGPSLLIETSGPEAWLVDRFAAVSPRPAAFSFVTGLTELLDAGATDFTPFAEAGIPGMHFAYLRGSPIYHTADDSLDGVGLGSLQHHGQHAIAVVEAFGDVDLAPPEAPDAAVYFTVGDGHVVRYPATWALPLVLLASIVVAAALGLRVRRIATSLRRMAAGAGIVAGWVALTGLVAAVAWRIVTTWRSTPAPWESYLYLMVLIGLGLAGRSWRHRRIAQRETPADVVGGSLLVWLLLAVATAMLSPAIGYVFVWPLLAAAGAVAWAGHSTGAWRARLFRLVMVAAPIMILMVPALEVLFQLAHPRPGNTDSQLVEVIGVVMILAMLAVELIAPFMPAGPGPRRPAATEASPAPPPIVDQPVTSSAGSSTT
jgi:hypothetical protein